MAIWAARLQFELHRRLLLSRDLLNARSCGSLGQLYRHPHGCVVRVVVVTVGGYHLAGVHGAAAAVLAERAARLAAILGCDGEVCTIN